MHFRCFRDGAVHTQEQAEYIGRDRRMYNKSRGNAGVLAHGVSVFKGISVYLQPQTSSRHLLRTDRAASLLHANRVMACPLCQEATRLLDA